MANSTRPWQAADGAGGGFILKPYIAFEAEAYRTASLRAKAILDAILRSFNGFNNGTIGVSMDTIAERIGNSNHAANRKAIAELVARGLITIEKTYPRGSRLAALYRITFISTGDAKTEIDATNEYRSWQNGDAGTGKRRPPPGKLGKKSLSTTATEEPQSVATVDDVGKLSVSTIATHNGSEPHSSVSTIATHIDYQCLSPSPSPKQGRERSGRPSHGIERPRSITEDSWIIAARRAAANPAGPEPEELREKVTAFVDTYGRGSQGRLAQSAGILEGTFSKFRKGDVDLPNRLRVQLACALERATAAEERKRPRPASIGGAR